MSKIFSTEELQTLVSGVDNLNPHDLAELVECFPFQNLINISPLNYGSMRLHLLFLIKLAKNDLFYKNAQAVTRSLEFALTNLSLLENVCVDDMLTNLLELLEQIIMRAKTIKEYAHDIARDRERILNILTSTAKLKIFGKMHVGNCTQILCHLLTMGGALPLTTSRNLAEISEIFKGLKAVYELAVICNLVLKKFTISTEAFNVCMPWLLIYGPSFLKEGNDDDDALHETLKAMNEFYAKYGYLKNRRRPLRTDLSEAFEEFILNLTQMSDQIISMAGKEKLREASLKLFSFLFCEKRGAIMCVKEKDSVVLNRLLELPLDVGDWPKVGSNIFFHVCGFLVAHSRLIWSTQEILSCISSLVYSYQRFSISLELLKTLCYIYPILMVDVLNKTTLLLGDDLLIIMSKWLRAFDEIHTPHVAQLVWILKRGDYALKKLVLCQWLKGEETDLATLGRAISQCNAGSVLLDIIIDPNVDEKARDKAMEMSHKIEDDDLSKNIAVLIPLALRREKLLHRLILSNPGIPDDSEFPFKICEFMSLILFTIADENVLKAACSYCKRLVTDLKRETSVVPLFCQDMDNIRFLAIKVKYVSDATAVEILRLLKVLILIQKRNHNKIEEKVEADLSQSLIGSENKVEKCLDLIQIVVTSRDVLMNLEESSIQNTFFNLFSLSKNPDFSVRSFVCLVGILRMYEWLAKVYSTSLFVEIQCSLRVDAKSGPEFVLFLSTWMKILKKDPGNEMYCVPNKRTISNYLKRADFISQTRATYLLQTLKKLKIFPDNTPPNRIRSFYQLCL